MRCRCTSARAKNLRERVGAHFSSDYRSATDLRLSAEIRASSSSETAGELGALLREAALVKALLPAHNHALRRKAESGVLALDAEPGPPQFVPAACRRTGRAARALRAVLGEAAGARSAARAGRRARAVLEGARARKARSGPASRGRSALRRRLRRRREPGRAPRRGCAPRSRRWRFRRGRSPGLAAIRERAALERADRRPRAARLVLARHRARRRRAAGADRRAAAAARSTPTSRGC